MPRIVIFIARTVVHATPAARRRSTIEERWFRPPLGPRAELQAHRVHDCDRRRVFPARSERTPGVREGLPCPVGIAFAARPAEPSPPQARGQAPPGRGRVPHPARRPGRHRPRARPAHLGRPQAAHQRAARGAGAREASHALDQLRWVIARFSGAGEPGWTAPADDELRLHFDERFLGAIPPPALVAVIGRDRRGPARRDGGPRPDPAAGPGPAGWHAVHRGDRGRAAAPPERPARAPLGRRVRDPRVAEPAPSGPKARCPPRCRPSPRRPRPTWAWSPSSWRRRRSTKERKSRVGARPGLGRPGPPARPWTRVTGFRPPASPRWSPPPPCSGWWPTAASAWTIRPTTTCAPCAWPTTRSRSGSCSPTPPGSTTPPELYADNRPELSDVMGPVIAATGPRGVVQPSNGGIAVLGQLVADVTAMPYADAAAGARTAPAAAGRLLLSRPRRRSRPAGRHRLQPHAGGHVPAGPGPDPHPDGGGRAVVNGGRSRAPGPRVVITAARGPRARGAHPADPRGARAAAGPASAGSSTRAARRGPRGRRPGRHRLLSSASATAAHVVLTSRMIPVDSIITRLHEDPS